MEPRDFYSPVTHVLMRSVGRPRIMWLDITKTDVKNIL